MTESHFPVHRSQPTLQAQDLRRSATKEFFDIWNRIPSGVRDLLYVSKEKPKAFGIGITISIKLDFETGNVYCEKEPNDDPSTLYVRQNLSVPANLSTVQRPSYYPSYAGLSPEQKYLYLSWLCNVMSPVDIGFVFIFYYGLERQLLLGDFDRAFDMIQELRKVHHNASFQGYSFSGLVYGCIFKNRPEKMNELIGLLAEERWENGQLLMCAKMNRPLAAEDVAKTLNGLSGINRRYLRNNRNEYLEALAEALQEKYGDSSLDLNVHFPINRLQRHNTILFANYTFPDEVRNASIPDYTHDPTFTAFLRQIHEVAHDRTKASIHEKGKRPKQNS
jgi:hypothetical protein